MRTANFLSIAAAAVFMVAISGPASAGAPSSPAGIHVRPVLEKGAKTILVSGDGDSSALVAGFNNIDAGEQFDCKKACSITAAEMVQFADTATGDEYAVCFVVDGTYYTCPYGGETVNTFWTVDNNLGIALDLAAGTHTVQTQLYVSDSTAVLANYTMRYDVLK